MTTPTDRKTTRRLYRSRRDRMLGGVAGGLGEYLGVDPVLVRLAFLVLLVAGGGGALAYIVAWIIVPEEPVGATPPPSPPPPARSGSAAARIVFGTILIGVGSLLLVQRLLPISAIYLWPILLIAGGAALLIYGTNR